MEIYERAIHLSHALLIKIIQDKGMELDATVLKREAVTGNIYFVFSINLKTVYIPNENLAVLIGDIYKFILNVCGR